MEKRERNKKKRRCGSSVPNSIIATATRHKQNSKQPCVDCRALLAVDGDRETTNAIRRFEAYAKRYSIKDGTERKSEKKIQRNAFQTREKSERCIFIERCFLFCLTVEIGVCVGDGLDCFVATRLTKHVNAESNGFFFFCLFR